MSTATENLKCKYCGLIHEIVCPRVKAIEYHPDGTTKRVEFHAPPPVTSFGVPEHGSVSIPGVFLKNARAEP